MNNMNYWKEIALSLLLGATVVSCANMASPSGGGYDLDPPKFVSSSPKMNETNFKGKKIHLYFDENVTVQEPSEKVIVTPPQKMTPKIFSANKRVEVELRDTLLPNTTYVIDFTDAIVDNNENNALENFSLAFSTGDKVDSLAVSGRVLTANDLEPMKGVYVGLHSNLSDTAFTSLPFERISRTNENGYFTIRGIAAGTYKIYALADIGRTYKYTDSSSAIAFLDTVIVPTSTSATRADSIFQEVKQKKSNLPQLVLDTVEEVGYTRFLPDDILLRTFVSSFQRKFLRKTERIDNRLMLYFGAPTPQPKMNPVNFTESTEWAIIERKPQNDTITYWLTDPKIIAIDTLVMGLDYLKTDSLNNDIPVTDTLTFTQRGKKEVKKKMKKIKNEEGKEIEVENIDFLNITNNWGEALNPNSVLEFEFDQPILNSDSLSTKLRIEQVKDSVTTIPIQYKLDRDSLNPRKYTISHRWEYGGEYKITIDSASVYSIYGKWNKPINLSAVVKKEDEFAKLAFVIDGLEGPAFVELLDKGDIPVMKTTVKNNIAIFRDVTPGTYYARITLDSNNNGKWDTGDFYAKKQPEVVSYYEGGLELKANFEIEQPWILDLSKLSKQKPLEITKNKPKEKASKRKQLEEEERKRNQDKEDQNNQNNPNNPYSPGMQGRDRYNNRSNNGVY